MVVDFIKKATAQADIFKNEYPDKMPEIKIFKDEIDGFVDNSIKDISDPEYVIVYLNNIIDLYENVKNSYLEYIKDKEGSDFVPDEVLINKQISLLYFNNSGVYDKKDNYGHKTADALMLKQGVDVGAESKFTYSLYIASLAVGKCIKNKDNKSLEIISDLISQLLFLVANTFHPSVIANVIKLAINNKVSIDHELEDGDKVSIASLNLLEYLLRDKYELILKSLFETLVIREGKFLAYNSDYTPGLNVTDKCSISCNDLVFSVLGKYVIKSYKEILDDANQNNWFNTILSNPVYDKFKKQLYTNVLCDLTVNTNLGEDETINTCRYLREKATEWIKQPDLSKRPDVPEHFEYIDISRYMSELYSYSMYHVGDVEKTVNKFDEEMKRISDFIKLPENKDKDMSEEKEKGKQIADRKKHYLTLKSLIGFLFLEILSNEKLSDKVYTPEFVLYVMMNEPGIDNAMHDIHSALMSLYSKRDFKPMGVKSNNPYFIHYGEGDDVASPEAKYIAKLASGLSHYNMSSRIVASSAYSFRELGNAIFSVGTSFEMYNTYFIEYLRNKIGYLNSHVSENVYFEKDIQDKVVEIYNKFDECYKNDKFVSKEDIEELISLIETINSVNNKLLTDKPEIKNDLNEKIGFEQYYCDSISAAINEYIDSYNSLVNIYSVLDKITVNTTMADATKTYISDKNEGKPQYSLWPRIIQYEYPIVEEKRQHKTIEQTHHENYMDLEPGDIESGYYKDPNPRTKSRYTTTKGC